MTDRRRFLRILAASPVAAAAGSFLSIGEKIPSDNPGVISREVKLRLNRDSEIHTLRIDLPSTIDGIESRGVNIIDVVHRQMIVSAQAATRRMWSQNVIEEEDLEGFMQEYINEGFKSSRYLSKISRNTSGLTPEMIEQLEKKGVKFE